MRTLCRVLGVGITLCLSVGCIEIKPLPPEQLVSVQKAYPQDEFVVAQAPASVEGLSGLERVMIRRKQDETSHLITAVTTYSDLAVGTEVEIVRVDVKNLDHASRDRFYLVQPKTSPPSAEDPTPLAQSTP